MGELRFGLETMSAVLFFLLHISLWQSAQRWADSRMGETVYVASWLALLLAGGTAYCTYFSPAEHADNILFYVTLLPLVSLIGLDVYCRVIPRQR